jgi:hypothetical protein
MGGVDGGECDKLVFFGVWPSDVDALKARLGPQVMALDLAVEGASCSLSPDDRRAWGAFMAQWLEFARKETPTFGSYGEWTSACSYAHTIDAWREKLASKCSDLPGPAKVPGAESSAEVVKWASRAAIAVAAIAAIGAGVYVVRKVI